MREGEREISAPSLITAERWWRHSASSAINTTPIPDAIAEYSVQLLEINVHYTLLVPTDHTMLKSPLEHSLGRHWICQRSCSEPATAASYHISGNTFLGPASQLHNPYSTSL